MLPDRRLADLSAQTRGARTDPPPRYTSTFAFFVLHPLDTGQKTMGLVDFDPGFQ